MPSLPLVTASSRLLASWWGAPRRGPARWAPRAAALAVGLAALAPCEAAACDPDPGSSNTNMQVLGVSQDGSSGWYRFSHRDDEGDESAFFLLDAAGREVARLEWSADIDQEAGGEWESTGEIDWTELAHEGSRPLSIDSITAAIQRRHGLTALRASPSPVRVTKQGEGCGRGEALTPDGPVTLVEIGGPDARESCPDPSLALFEHPHSSFFFLRVSYLSTRPTYDVRFHGFELIPRTRLAGARAAARGRKAQLRGDLGAAIGLYEEALRLAPEYVEPRIWAAQAAVAAHWSSASGLAFLEWPFPGNAKCIGDPTLLSDWVDRDLPIAWLNLRGLDGPTPWDVCGSRSSSLHDSWSPPERPPTRGDEPAIPLVPDPTEEPPAPPTEAVAPLVAPVVAAAPAPAPLLLAKCLALAVVSSFLTGVAMGYLDRWRNRPTPRLPDRLAPSPRELGSSVLRRASESSDRWRRRRGTRTRSVAPGRSRRPGCRGS
jgi:hypothetical protein